MKLYSTISSPIGKLTVIEENDTITGLLFEGESVPESARPNDTPLLRRAASQLEEYFGGKRPAFDLPLQPKGTAFQLSVWSALTGIPAGTTRTYGEIAVEVGNPKAARAVGMANNRNPIPIFIPCHRVIGSNGGLTGFRAGLGVKENLLELERKNYR